MEPSKWSRLENWTSFSVAILSRLYFAQYIQFRNSLTMLLLDHVFFPLSTISISFTSFLWLTKFFVFCGDDIVFVCQYEYFVQHIWWFGRLFFLLLYSTRHLHTNQNKTAQWKAIFNFFVVVFCMRKIIKSVLGLSISMPTRTKCCN